MNGGMVFEPGSVVSFTAVNFEVAVVTWEKDWMGNPLVTLRAVGWGLICQSRDMWVMKTKVQPMVICSLCADAGVIPLETHWSAVHGEAGWAVTPGSGS